MERDAICAHGTVNFITESMMERADKYQMAICNNTSMIAIVNPDKNLFLSPMCDGPIKFIGSIDGKDMNIENISKFGRSFSIVQVPYSLKLLIQELMAINIQLRIITEDNIEQIENMSFSNNIEKLSGLSSVNELCNTLKKQIRDNNFSDQYVFDQDLESSLDNSNKEFEIKPIDYIDDPGDFLIQAKTLMNLLLLNFHQHLLTFLLPVLILILLNIQMILILFTLQTVHLNLHLMIFFILQHLMILLLQLQEVLLIHQLTLILKITV